MPKAAQDITGDTWTLIYEEAAQANRPIEYVVACSSGSVEVCCPGLPGHPDGAPTGTDEGITLASGESVAFASRNDRIGLVYAKATTATITHGATAK